MSGIDQGAPARRMRRAEKEITDPAAIDGILASAQVLYLAMRDEPAPYVIPVSFGCERGRLYIHGAREGTKLALLRADPRVGFSAHEGFQVVRGKEACGFSARARSVVGTGTARIVTDGKEIQHGLDLIMRHYAGEPSEAVFSYAPQSLERTLVIAIDIQNAGAKRIG